MKKNTIFFLLLLIVFTGFIAGSVEGASQITITDLFDNTLTNPPIKGTSQDWGFSCFIEGTEKTILFDTGGGLNGTAGQTLIRNIESLGIPLDKLDLIVISHNHPDHTGGLNNILAKKTGIPVYFGNAFPASFSQNVTDKGAIPVRVKEPIEICKDVYSTGEVLGSAPAYNEQSLILDTPDGLVVIVGCAHPGIVTMLKKAKEILNKDIYLVIGGFHMLDTMLDDYVKKIVQEFQAVGVKKCGTTHCTESKALSLFKQAYGEDFITMGVGKVIQLSIKPVMVSEENDGQSVVPNRFKLDQNYPNPFNPQTTIRV